MQNTTRQGSQACEQENSDDILALSARLTDLADRISGTKRGSRSPTPSLQMAPEDRIWPNLPEYPEARQRAKGLDFTLADLDIPLPSAADELRLASEQIDQLVATVAALRQDAERRDIDLATAMQNLIEAEDEKSDLRATLDAECQKSAALRQRVVEIKTAFNDQLVDFTINRETAERLSQELIIAKTEAPKFMAAANVEAHRILADHVAQLSERHELEMQELQMALAEREQQKAQIEQTHAELAGLFHSLSNRIADLEAENLHSAETIRNQASQIEFLDTATVIERQNAEATIKELIAEFGRERERMLARDQETAEIRKNIVQLLPRLIARDSTADPVTAQVA